LGRTNRLQPRPFPADPRSKMKSVIVTGGTYGIGKGISLGLSRRGYGVVAFGVEVRQPGSLAENVTESLRSEARELGLTMDVLEADVSKAADVQRVIEFTLHRYGFIYGLVNNAAIGPLGNILETPEDLWDRIIDVNLKGMYLACKAVLPNMIRHGGGSIVNLGSGAGWGKPNMLAYAASKGGVFALGASLAYDHFRDHVRVNTVVPGGGGIVTGMSLGRVGGDLEKLSRGGSGTVAGRSAEPADVEAAVAFLLSDEAAAISGTVIDVGCFSHQGGPIPSNKTVLSVLGESETNEPESGQKNAQGVSSRSESRSKG
jgi:NAD(P)-dependent dehydrogenase (short-subunit alcohol dehydrogenase family)